MGSEPGRDLCSGSASLLRGSCERLRHWAVLRWNQPGSSPARTWEACWVLSIEPRRDSDRAYSAPADDPNKDSLRAVKVCAAFLCAPSPFKLGRADRIANLI